MWSRRLVTAARWLFVAALAFGIAYMALHGKGCIGQRVDATCYAR